MKYEKQQHLIQTYQPLYEHCKYFECGDGWYGIIDSLSYLLNQMIKDKDLSCRASQVKEKYGTLRFYMDSETDEMSKWIEIAEEKSSRTCEYCGETGKLREGGWVQTLCDKCNEPKK
jgi:uncharacterized Zn-finger protein